MPLKQFLAFPFSPRLSRAPRNVLDEGILAEKCTEVSGSTDPGGEGEKERADVRASERARERDGEEERKRQKFIKTADATGTVLGWTNWFSRVFSLLCIIRRIGPG